MNLFTYTIHRPGRIDFKKDIMAVDQAHADQQLLVWQEKMNFQEPVTTSAVYEPLPNAIAFYLSGKAETDEQGDRICGDWQKWKLLTSQHIRSVSVEDEEDGKRVEFYRHDYENVDSFLNSLASHRYPDRADEVAVTQYSEAVDTWIKWLHKQVRLPLAKAFNDSHHLGGANDTWWKLITPEALIILNTYQHATHTIKISPHSPEDEDYGYQFQLDRVKPTDAITLDEFTQHLEDYLALFFPESIN